MHNKTADLPERTSIGVMDVVNNKSRVPSSRSFVIAEAEIEIAEKVTINSSPQTRNKIEVRNVSGLSALVV